MSWVPTIVAGAVSLITAYQNEIGDAVSWFWRKITGNQLREKLKQSRLLGHHKGTDAEIEECVKCWDAGEPHFLAQAYEPEPTLAIEGNGTAKELVLEKQGDGHAYKVRTMQAYTWRMSQNAGVAGHDHVWSKAPDLVVSTGFTIKPGPGVCAIVEPWQWPVPNVAPDAHFGNRWDIMEHITNNWTGREMTFRLRQNDSTASAYPVAPNGLMIIPKGTIIATLHFVDCSNMTGNRINEIVLRDEGIWEEDTSDIDTITRIEMEGRAKDAVQRRIQILTKQKRWKELADMRREGIIKPIEGDK